MQTKRNIVGLLGFLLLILSGCGKNNPEAESAATKSAEIWLQLIDNKEYKSSWQTAAPIFKQSITEQGWANAVESARQPLGVVKNRRLIRASYKTSLPGAPDGEYVMIQYRTDFENKKSAIETITPMFDTDGQWRVSGYFIK